MQSDCFVEACSRKEMRVASDEQRNVPDRRPDRCHPRRLVADERIPGRRRRSSSRPAPPRPAPNQVNKISQGLRLIIRWRKMAAALQRSVRKCRRSGQTAACSREIATRRIWWGGGFGLATCVELQEGPGRSVKSSSTKLFSPLAKKWAAFFFFFLWKYITLLLEGARPWAPAGSMEALWGSAGGVLRQGRGWQIEDGANLSQNGRTENPVWTGPWRGRSRGGVS